MVVSPRSLLLMFFLLTVPALCKPFLRVDIRNGAKVPPTFLIEGKTSPRCRVLVEVSSWDGFGAEFETLTDRRGRFSLPVTIEGRTITTHVDITVRSFDLDRQTMREISRYVILDRNCQE